MSRYLIEHDGLFLGSSSACNLVACIKLVKKMGWKDGQRVVTILYAVGLVVSNFVLTGLILGVIQVADTTQRCVYPSVRETISAGQTNAWMCQPPSSPGAVLVRHRYT